MESGDEDAVVPLGAAKDAITPPSTSTAARNRDSISSLRPHSPNGDRTGVSTTIYSPHHRRPQGRASPEHVRFLARVEVENVETRSVSPRRHQARGTGCARALFGPTRPTAADARWRPSRETRATAAAAGFSKDSVRSAALLKSNPHVSGARDLAESPLGGRDILAEAESEEDSEASRASRADSGFVVYSAATSVTSEWDPASGNRHVLPPSQAPLPAAAPAGGKASMKDARFPLCAMRGDGSDADEHDAIPLCGSVSATSSFEPEDSVGMGGL